MNFTTIFTIVSFTAFAAVVIIAIILIDKLDKIKSLEASLAKLRRAFDELDEQAKLIVRTDLELNKTQEELDKKVGGLYTLQKLSQLISTTLDEEEIFRRLSEPLMIELGAEKGFIFTKDKNQQFSRKMSFGYPVQELAALREKLLNDELFAKILREGSSMSSLWLPEAVTKKINALFDVACFIMYPLLTQDGTIGILFMGNKSLANPFTEGDVDLISIFATQLGQSIENARLFEEVYKSHQQLEVKIQERTKELADALEEVRKISRKKSDFVSAVSHELRTPLTSIKGYASILMSGKLGDIPEAASERLLKVNQHSDNLVKLINDLLDISRIESGKIVMKREPVNLAAVVGVVADLLMPQLKEKQIELIVQIPQEIPPIPADASQIERVFINLISNAIKFTPEKGAITVSGQTEAGSVSVAVSDTGIGISEEDRRHIFDEFYRVDNPVNEKTKGTGLGLSLVKQIIEAHKGTIAVTGNAIKGSTFTVTLPLG